MYRLNTAVQMVEMRIHTSVAPKHSEFDAGQLRPKFSLYCHGIFAPGSVKTGHILNHDIIRQ